MELMDTLRDIHTNELYRAYISNKDYMVVLHLGYNYTKVVLTNNIDKYSTYSSDELLSITPLDYDSQEYIKDMLVARLSKYSRDYTKVCYLYTFKDFLATHSLSEYKYKQLLKLEKGN